MNGGSNYEFILLDDVDVYEAYLRIVLNRHLNFDRKINDFYMSW